MSAIAARWTLPSAHYYCSRGWGRAAVTTGGFRAARIDATVLARLTEDLGEDHVADVCAMFLGDARGVADEIGVACASGDAGSVACLAHRLKSACGFVGAGSVAALCSEIEQLARSDRLAEARPRADVLRGELRETAAELAAFVEARGPTT